MSRKPIYGMCRLCRENTKLTFEHVPPETTFNDSKVFMLTGEELINSIANENILPWEFEKGKGKIQQRGKGGYFLCADCNSKTGKWYVPEYSKFVKGMHNAIMQITDQEYKFLKVKMQGVRPLLILKQIMTMFCDINEGLTRDEVLKEFILNKKSQKFDNKKYRVYTYIHAGEIERTNGISVMLSTCGAIMLTEISMYPIGFVLYIDKPESYRPEGVEISCFSDFRYEDETIMEMIIPKLENNIVLSGDYRTKEEIIRGMDGNGENN